MSTQDRSSVLANGATVSGTVFPAIGDKDGDQREPIGAAHDPHYADDGSDYLDDVAKYLYDTDLRSDLTGLQNITTYTIGFTTDNDLLERTATNGHGRYYYSSRCTDTIICLSKHRRRNIGRHLFLCSARCSGGPNGKNDSPATIFTLLCLNLRIIKCGAET